MRIKRKEFKQLAEGIYKFIRKETQKREKKGGLVGISGGLDSAVTTFLIKEALGQSSTLGLTLVHPDFKEKDKEDALALSEQLGIEHKIVDIAQSITSFNGVIAPNILENKSSDFYLAFIERLATAIFYSFADSRNYLVVSSSNLTEYLSSFYSVGGYVGDIFPIAGLYKTEVRLLGRYLGLPEEILRKQPSDGFKGRQPDEHILGAPYFILDIIYHAFSSGKDIKQISKLTGSSRSFLKEIKRRMKDSKQKLAFPFFRPKLDREKIFQGGLN